MNKLKGKEIVITLEDKIHKQFKEFCKENGYTMSGFLKAVIREQIKK